MPTPAPSREVGWGLDPWDIHFEHFCTVYRRKQWHPTLVLLPGKAHGRRNLVGYSPWCRKESDKTEQLHFHLPEGTIIRKKC